MIVYNSNNLNSFQVKKKRGTFMTRMMRKKREMMESWRFKIVMQKIFHFSLAQGDPGTDRRRSILSFPPFFRGGNFFCPVSVDHTIGT